MNKKHRLNNTIISKADWEVLSIEDQGYYVDTVLAVNHTLITEEDIFRYLDI